MVKKKVDARVRTLIENGVRTNHRTFFVLVGDKGKDQVVTLHYMLNKAKTTGRPSVLWCYKKELGFSRRGTMGTSHRKKRMKQIKKAIQRGLLDPDKDDPFELFISSTEIRYCYYKETHKILGNTFGMCILQDFEALTPNLLARTVETVEGGGIVVLLLRTMASLKQLYTMAMDVHDRYRTEAHQDVVARFNERFLLSLAHCENCLVLDDELNVLTISDANRTIEPIPASVQDRKSAEELELEELKKSLEDTQPIGPLIKGARTLDQAKAILTFVDAISEKTLRTTVALTAARGRGKSAALGLAIAAAVAYGYSNIFVTSPSPENLKTLFEFILKGFDALGYEEHLDYDIMQSTNPAFNNAVVRINIFRDHRQTIQMAHRQYIQPQDAKVLGQAELVVIDEAAAIPLPYVRALLGPYLVFMASTINGYEGTGRSLSLKLIQQLREQSASAKTETTVTSSAVVKSSGAGGANADVAQAAKTVGGRVLKEVKLSDPIRYGRDDPVERWLNQLLCLDASIVPRLVTGCPHPSTCELYYVNRDTLFSYHRAAEAFLQRLVGIYVASHYKNTPNDLQLLSDAPAHNIFVLLPPVPPNTDGAQLPEVLAVIQVALEGEISKQSVLNGLARGERAAGDLIPWTISQQFQDSDFGGLSGGRIVRIATHPDYQNMGYGARALELLRDYYNGRFTDVMAPATSVADRRIDRRADAEDQGEGLNAVVRPRKNLPPLLSKLSERPPERLHYLGVSYGLTQPLHKFWKRAGYVPVYLRQTPNELTGEYTCIMLHALERADRLTSMSKTWLADYWKDFKRRFLQLLAFQFREFSPILALEILSHNVNRANASVQEEADQNAVTKSDLDHDFSPYDLKRLDSYAKNMLDYHVIVDLVPTIAMHVFLGHLPSVHLSAVQSAILAGVGLQRKTVEDLERELSLPASQIMALFNKVMRKVNQVYRDVLAAAVQEEMDVSTKKAKKAKKSHPSDADDSRMPVDADDGADDEDEAVDADAADAEVKADGGDEDAEEDEEDEEANNDEFEPLEESLDEELNAEARKINKRLREEQRKLIDSLDLSQYAVGGRDEDWAAALKKKQPPASVSIANPGSSRLKVHAQRASGVNEALAKANAEVVPGRGKRPKPSKAGKAGHRGGGKR